MRRILSLNVLKDNSENTKPNDSDYGTYSRFYIITVHNDITVASICFAYLYYKKIIRILS